jgi:hypothetical protein
MRIHNLYVDSAGESHFRDIEVAWEANALGGRMSKLQPARGIVFRRTEGNYDLDWHNAPCRQYVINLDASIEVTASDGETRVIGAGEVLLVEDTTGKGHISRSVAGQVRHSVFIPIE